MSWMPMTFGLSFNASRRSDALDDAIAGLLRPIQKAVPIER